MCYVGVSCVVGGGIYRSDGDVGYYQALSYSNDPNMDRQHILMSNDELQRVSLAAGALRCKGVNHIYDCVIGDAPANSSELQERKKQKKGKG